MGNLFGFFWQTNLTINYSYRKGCLYENFRKSVKTCDVYIADTHIHGLVGGGGEVPAPPPEDPSSNPERIPRTFTTRPDHDRASEGT